MFQECLCNAYFHNSENIADPKENQYWHNFIIPFTSVKSLKEIKMLLFLGKKIIKILDN